MDDTKKEVLDTIKKDNLQPQHALFFALKHIGIWFLWACTVFIGAFAFSAFLFRLFNSGFEYAHLTAASSFQFILSSFPFLWMFLIIVSTIVAYIEFRGTERGYLISWRQVVLLNMSFSLLIGSILFLFGFGYVGERLAHRFEGSRVEYTYLARFNDVSNGRIAGIASVIDDDTLSLLSIDNTSYIVDISGLGSVMVPINVPVRILGVLSEEDSFYACRILPVRFRGAFRREEVTFQRVGEINVEDERTTLCRGISTLDY